MKIFTSKVILFLLAFVVGDCIMLTRGVFKGSYWTVIGVNANGTFDLKDRDWTLTNVRGSYLSPANWQECREN